MKKLFPAFFLGMLLLSSCNEEKKTEQTEKTESDFPKTNDEPGSPDQQQITILVRDMLRWNDSDKQMDLLPAVVNEGDTIYTGFDMIQLSKNVKVIKDTGYFTDGFVKNYESIILNLDIRLRNNQYEKWSTGELPPFTFANDFDPFCSCQDIPEDWNTVQTKVIKLEKDKGELFFMFGSSSDFEGKTPEDYATRFKVIKENGIWKIDYIDTFNYNNAIKEDGL